jgi:hypothetical protein
MKKLTLILLATLSILANEARAAWPTTKATICWSYGTGAFMKAQITPQGSGFFTVNSILIENGKLNNVGGGTAYIKGDTVYWTLDLAGNGQEAMWTDQIYLVINKTSLVGQFESISHDKNFAEGSLDTEYEINSITLTPVPCKVVGW